MTAVLPERRPEATIGSGAADEVTADRRAAGILHRSWRGARAWLAVGDRAIALGVLTTALVIGMWNVNGSPGYQDDEGTYTAQAVAVQNGGLAPYTYWYDHPPLGWIQYAVLGWIPQALGLGNGSDLAAMRYGAAFLFALTALLVFLLARRIGLSVPFAMLAPALFLLSPLSLSLGRQVFLDTVAVPWILLAFHLALSPRRALWDHVGAGIAFAIGVLSKLTVAIVGPAVLVAVMDRGRRRPRVFSLVGFLGVGALVLALYPVMALLRGELLSGPDRVSLQDAIAYQFLSRSGSGWIWETGSSRHELLEGWLFLDSFLIVGGLACGLLCLLSVRTRWIAVALLCLAVPVAGSQGYLPAMYVIGALPLLALAVAAAADGAWRALLKLLPARGPGSRAGTTAIGALVIIALVVFIPFRQWVDRGMPLLTDDDNADWRATLAWVTENVPTDDTVVVPYSLWQDVDKHGWNDPWRAIVLEKVDLDEEFRAAHPRGWVEIDWIVEGPTVAPNIDHLALEEVRKAFDSSRVVVSFGAWHVREVITPSASAVGTHPHRERDGE